MLGKTVWVIAASGKGKHICGITFAEDLGLLVEKCIGFGKSDVYLEGI